MFRSALIAAILFAPLAFAADPTTAVPVPGNQQIAPPTTANPQEVGQFVAEQLGQKDFLLIQAQSTINAQTREIDRLNKALADKTAPAKK